jgi:outer membrane protein assembly factor BamB
MGSDTNTPAIHDGTVFAGSFELVARDLESGDVKWTVKPNTDGRQFLAPVATESTVYVPETGLEPIVYAFDAATGEERWRASKSAPIDASVAVANGMVYVVDRENNVSAITTETGEREWQVSVGNDVGQSPPVATSGLLYLGAKDGTVIALQTADGTVAWRNRITNGFGAGVSIGVANTTLFGVENEGTIVAADATDGTIEWETEVGSRLGGPAIADGMLYVGAPPQGGDTALFGFDTETGTEQWRVDTRRVSFGDYTESGINVAPAVTGEAVYVATAAGELYAVTGG